jgi:hypothetical protein
MPAKAAVKNGSEFGFNGDEGGIKQFATGDDHDVESRRKLVMAENLSNQSLGPVADDRTADLASGGDAETTDRQVIRQREQRQELPVNLATAVVNPLEVGPASNMLCASELDHSD